MPFFKMQISKLQEKVKSFEAKTKFDKTSFEELIKMITEELNILEKNSHDEKIVNHQITDLLILILQISNRYNTNFESEIKHWIEKSKKYY